MLNEKFLDETDEKIINELDNLCGVIQNKEVLINMIMYIKLKQEGKITFGNCNIIIRNNSSYNLLNGLLNVCGKIFTKYKIIPNDKICYLDKITNNHRNCPFDRITGIDAGIIVINERKLKLDYTDEIENLKKLVNMYNDRVFVFEDTGFCEGAVDAELGDIANWKMTIEKISLEDKTMYCKQIFDNNNLKYQNQDIKKFADKPFWQLKYDIMQVIVECKSKNETTISREMLKNKDTKNAQTSAKRNSEKKDKNEKKAETELSELVGLVEVKKQMNKILNYIKVNKVRDNMPALNMCFTGNPGTGKTSIARIIGKIFEEENILQGDGNFVEIHGRDLIAKYVGWTAQKVHEVVNKALGGVLFIDEAYSLLPSHKGGFEEEAIATLIKEMEDHRQEICIIFAGYTEEMDELIKSNPGFESRIQFKIDFPDYSESELVSIFEQLCKKEKYKLSPSCKELLLDNFNKAKQQENFGNGRYVRNLFEKVKFEQANRVVKDLSNKDLIRKCDIEVAVSDEKIPKQEKVKIGFSA